MKKLLFLSFTLLVNLSYGQDGNLNRIPDTYDFELNENVFNIPIIFHVVHDSLVDGDYSDDFFSQLIGIVNKKINNVDIDLISEHFQDDVSKPNINFYLPNVDDNCNKIDNISWHYTKRKKFVMHAEDIFAFKNSGRGYLDSKKYLNVWICNFSDNDSGIAGYKSHNLALDGLVIDVDQLKYKKFPILLVHEIGHWLGLSHIWGDTWAGSKGNCSDDDGIIDTPRQKGANIRTDKAGEFCDEGITNHQNFMDYSYDVGMFTHGQKKAMRDYIKKRRMGTQWKPSCEDLVKGYIKDSRDGGSYQWVQIGNQKWLTQNLNYKTPDSKCYKNKETNCSVYGRLYNWNEAINACPDGWRLPNYKDWKTLVSTIGNDAKPLKSKHGWIQSDERNNSTGLSLLPSGMYSGYRGYNGMGKTVDLWLANSNGMYAYSRTITTMMGKSYIPTAGQHMKTDLLACRCIKGMPETIPNTINHPKTNENTKNKYQRSTRTQRKTSTSKNKTLSDLLDEPTKGKKAKNKQKTSTTPQKKQKTTNLTELLKKKNQ